MPAIKATMVIGRRTVPIKVLMCSDQITQLAKEVGSALNHHGAQKRFGTESPSPEQLVNHYFKGGGLDALWNKVGAPEAELCSI